MSDSPVLDPKQTVAASISRSIFEVGLEAAGKFLQGQYPLLAMPVVGDVFLWFFKTIMRRLYEGGENGVSFVVIGITVDQQNEKFKEASAALKEAIKTKTPEEIAREKKKFEDALRDLIRLRA